MIITAPKRIMFAMVAAAGLIGLLAAQLSIAVSQRLAALFGASARNPISATVGLCAPAAGVLVANPRPTLFIGCGIIE